MRVRSCRLIVPTLVALLALPIDAEAQRLVSIGLASAVPVGDGPYHALGTLQLAHPRSPVLFRADLLFVNASAPGGTTRLAGNLLLPLLRRDISPYLIGGAGWAFGSVGHPVSASAGVGVSARVDRRSIFAESRYHWAYDRALFSVGVQF